MPVSWKTTGRIGDSLRHSQGFWSRFLGTRRRVHRFGPGGIGALALVERREPEPVDGFIPVVAGGEGFQRVRVHQLQGAGDGRAEMVFPQAEPFL